MITIICMLSLYLHNHAHQLIIRRKTWIFVYTLLLYNTMSAEYRFDYIYNCSESFKGQIETMDLLRYCEAEIVQIEFN